LLLAVALAFSSAAATAGVGTWTTNGPPGGAAAVAIDPGDTSTLYVPPWRSPDRGSTWWAVDRTGEIFFTASLATGTNKGLLAGPAGTVYAPGQGQNDEFELLLKSQTVGLTWEEIDQYQVFCTATQLLIDPINPDVIYVTGASCPGIPGLTPPTGFLNKSLNGGHTWLVGPWFHGLTGLDLGPPSALGMDPSSPNTLYISTLTGLFKSLDGGGNWSFLAPAANLPEQPRVLIVDPINPLVLYMSVHFGGVFKSTDGGLTFRPVNNGLPEVLAVSSLVIDASHPNRLFVAVGGIGPPPNGTFDQRAGVFATHDGGESWMPLNDGLPDLHDPASGGGRLDAFFLAIDPQGKFLLAATPEGVFEYEFPPVLEPIRLPGSPRSVRTVPPRQ